jgi:hypothetical protein
MSDDVTGAPVVPIASAVGEFPVVGPVGSTVGFTGRVLASEIATAAALAASAVQPEDLGTAASLSVEDLDARINDRLGDIDAALDALLGPS